VSPGSPHAHFTHEVSVVRRVTTRVPRLPGNTETKGVSGLHRKTPWLASLGSYAFFVPLRLAPRNYKEFEDHIHPDED
jgi:hypothetical protein